MVATPRNAVVILLDSLNRHMLGAYGGTEFATPNLDAFARTAVRFDNHHTGSLPCMPARHDILCGALDFLRRPWGSVEIWEDAITYELHKAGVVSFTLEGVHPHDLGTILDSEGVAVRAGHHCAMPVMEFFDVAATARASLGCYSNAADIDQLVAALGHAREVFG